MNNGYTEQIRDRIMRDPMGTVYVNSDFTDIADANTIKQSINRMVHDGTLRRIMRGIYDRPKYSTLLGEYIAADPNAVAAALARSYHWTIAPCGETALNLLGLSTQVPAVWSYISDGPYKTYKWDNIEIVFKHRTNREVTGLAPMTIMVIQGLKTLGRAHVDAQTVRVISRRLSDNDRNTLLAESADATDWVRRVIKDICIGGNHDQNRASPG